MENQGTWICIERHTLTFACSGGACGIALPCNAGGVCGWVEAPKDELERKEWREGRRSNPTWAAEKDAAFWGSGCPPSARGNAGGGENAGKWSVKERKRQQTKAEIEYEYNDIQMLFMEESKRGLQAVVMFHTYFVQILAAHIIRMKMQYSSCRSQGGRHNQIKTLQVTSQINNRVSGISGLRSDWKPKTNREFPARPLQILLS